MATISLILLEPCLKVCPRPELRAVGKMKMALTSAPRARVGARSSAGSMAACDRARYLASSSSRAVAVPAGPEPLCAMILSLASFEVPLRPSKVSTRPSRWWPPVRMARVMMSSPAVTGGGNTWLSPW